MNVSIADVVPNPSEPLGQYIQRVRDSMRLTQLELSIKAGIHIQTIRKIESGATSRLSQKCRSGLAAALGIPQEYLARISHKKKKSLMKSHSKWHLFDT